MKKALSILSVTMLMTVLISTPAYAMCGRGYRYAQTAYVTREYANVEIDNYRALPEYRAANDFYGGGYGYCGIYGGGYCGGYGGY